MKALIIIFACIGALFLSAAAIAQVDYVPPPASAGALTGIKFSSATPVDENYRREFDKCDQQNTFKGKAMTGFRKCSGDPNRARALLKFPDGTIFFESKLGLDIDGSWKACNDAGLTDLCPTWMSWPNLPVPKRYVDSDIFPYVVIPIAGLSGGDTEFRDKTGLKQGDLGVVVFKDKIVPVFIADGGPHNKLGEGSNALFKGLGEDRCREWGANGHCRKYKNASIERGVLTFLFPNSRISGLNPENALEKVRAEALAKFERLKQP